MSNIERPYNILIAKAGVENSANGLADLKEGEIILIKQDGTIYEKATDSFATSEFIYVVQGTAAGEAPKYSAKIKGDKVTAVKAASHAAATEQVSFIGNNGAAGSIEGGNSGIVNGQEYSMHIVIKGVDKDLYSKRQLRKSFSFVADASGTELEVRDGLVKVLVSDPAFSDGAAASVKAGAVIKVSKVDDGTNYGIKLEGLAVVAKTKDEYEQVIFEIGLDKGFTAATRLAELGYIYLNGAAPVAEADLTLATSSKLPSKGVGTAQLVKDMEEFAQGFQGISNKTGFPVADYPKYAVSGMDYDLVIIEHESVHASGNLEQSVVAPLMSIIALPKASRDGAAAKAGAVLLPELNDYMASVPKGFAAVSV